MGEKCAKKAAAAVAKSMMSSVLRKQALASLPDVTVQALFEVRVVGVGVVGACMCACTCA